MIEKWNQTHLGYFNLHFNRAHRESEIVLVEKDVYYKNVVLVVQRFESVVIFWVTVLVKADIATSFQDSTPKWYTSKLSNFDYDVQNNNPGIKIWVNTLSHWFKVPTNVSFGLLIDETYFIKDTWAWRSSA